MSGADTLLIVMPESGVGTPVAYQIQRDHQSASLQRIELDLEAVEADEIVLALPVIKTSFHHFELPELTPLQANAAAVRLALEASIDPLDLHVAAGACGERTIAVTIAKSDMEQALAWASDHGIHPDVVIPAGLLVPFPTQGFICARIGNQLILRSTDMVLSDHEPVADMVTAGQPVQMLDDQQTAQAVADVLADPPLNLLSGPYTSTKAAAADPASLRRSLYWASGAICIFVLTILALIMKYYWDARRLDADSVALVQPFVANPIDHNNVESELSRKITRSAAIGVTGPISVLFRATRSSPTVNLSLLSRGEDGVLRATLAAPRTEDINAVLLAVQVSGFRITATSTSGSGGGVLAEITVE